MEETIVNEMIRVASERLDMGSMETPADEANFFTGAMSMYLALNPESEENGSWCPPYWLFTIIRGESIVETHYEIEADRAIERAEIKAERDYDARHA